MRLFTESLSTFTMVGSSGSACQQTTEADLLNHLVVVVLSVAPIFQDLLAALAESY